MSETGFMGGNLYKYQDTELASRLWPIYLQSGNLETVFRHCDKTGIAISKPTLLKLADHFGWKQKYSEATKNTFAANLDSDGDLQSILAEIVFAKNKIREIIKASPNNMEAHSRLGTYISQILAIKKTIAQTQAVDKKTVILEALNLFVNYAREKNNEALMVFLDENLESIADELELKL